MLFWLVLLFLGTAFISTILNFINLLCFWVVLLFVRPSSFKEIGSYFRAFSYSEGKSISGTLFINHKLKIIWGIISAVGIIITISVGGWVFSILGKGVDLVKNNFSYIANIALIVLIGILIISLIYFVFRAWHRKNKIIDSIFESEWIPGVFGFIIVILGGKLLYWIGINVPKSISGFTTSAFDMIGIIIGTVLGVVFLIMILSPVLAPIFAFLKDNIIELESKIARMRTPIPKNISAEEWQQKIKASNKYEQTLLLSRASVDALSLNDEKELLNLFIEVESIIIKEDPAQSEYWKKRHKLEEQFRQEEN